MARGVSIKNWQNNLCPVCKCIPCEDSFDCRKARGIASYETRKSSSKDKKEANSKPKPTMSKTKFINRLKKRNPTISDADIKRELRKAGYSTGCAIIAVIALSTPLGGAVWGIIEIIQAVS